MSPLGLTEWLKSEIVHKPYLTKSDYIWVRLSKTKRNLVKANIGSVLRVLLVFQF